MNPIYFQRAATVLFGALLAFLPLAVDLDCYDPSLSSQLLIGGIGATLLAIVGFALALKQPPGRLGLIGLLALLGLLAWSALAAKGAVHALEAQLDLARTGFLLSIVIMAGLITRGSREQIAWIFRAMVVAVLLQALLGVLQIGDSLDWPHANTAPPYGSFPNKNFFAICLAMYAPGVGWIAGQKNTLWKWLARLGLVCIVLMLVATGTRSAAIGLLAGALTIIPLVCSTTRNWWPFRNPTVWLGILLVGMLAGAGLLFVRYGLDLERGGDLEASFSNSMMERGMQWHHSLEMIKDEPLLGVAPGHWKTELNQYGVDNFVVEVRYGSMMYQRPHNDFIWVAAETGLPGLLLLITVLIVGLLASISHWRRTGSMMGLVVLGGIMIYIGVALFSFPRERIVPLLILGTYLGIAFWANVGEATTKAPKWQLLLPVIALLGGVGAAYLGKQFNTGSAMEQQLQQLRKIQRFDGAATLAQQARTLGFTLDRTAVPLVYYEAEALMARGDFEDANVLLKQSLEYNSGHLFTWANLGNIAFKAQDFEAALRYYDHLLSLSPRMEEILMNRAAALYQVGRFEEAMTTLKKAEESLTTDRYDRLNQAIQKALREQRKASGS